jgi:glycine/D-amino acid oxidase-like deaminating enzyme
MYMLNEARGHGVKLINARITRVLTSSDVLRGVQLEDGGTITSPIFVNAAGPFIKDVGELIGIDIPVYCELHLKVAFRDVARVVPRKVPLLIWTDPQKLLWTYDERELLGEDEDTAWLLEEMPGGVHTRPEGSPESDIILMLWEYHLQEVAPIWPPVLDDQYPEIALRGLTTMIPGLKTYLSKSPRPVLDGGYYTKTRENRPLICPLAVEGAFMIGALSGYGVMAACAAGELLASHVSGSPLPSYAQAFDVRRYENPNYLNAIQNMRESGQL